MNKSGWALSLYCVPHPLNRRGDKHVNSPFNIHTLSSILVLRMNSENVANQLLMVKMVFLISFYLKILIKKHWAAFKVASSFVMKAS